MNYRHITNLLLAFSFGEPPTKPPEEPPSVNPLCPHHNVIALPVSRLGHLYCPDCGCELSMSESVNAVLSLLRSRSS